MEKLSLNKFQDAKLETNQMSYINAGLYPGECTGGGVSWRRYQIGSDIIEVTKSWSSDEMTGYTCNPVSYYGMQQTSVLTHTGGC